MTLLFFIYIALTTSQTCVPYAEKLNSNTGSITANSVQNDNCIWVITPNTSKSGFWRMSLPLKPSLSNDIVFGVFKGNQSLTALDLATPLLYYKEYYSGTSVDYSFDIDASGLATIILTGTGVFTFNISYSFITSPPCSNFTLAPMMYPSGQLILPQYGQSFTCYWKFQLQTKGVAIQLNFTMFQVDPDMTVLTIHDGPTPTSNILFNGSSGVTPFITQTNSTEAYVVYKSTSPTQLPGISITYTSYPCLGTKKVQFDSGSVSGTFTDGSDSEPYFMDYINNLNCAWLFNEPSDGSFKYLRINYYINSISTGDVLTLYNGTNSSFPVVYSSSVTSNESGEIRLQSRSFYTTWTTDSVNTAKGWNIQFFKSFCDLNMTINAANGSLEDGSGPLNPISGDRCNWYIFSSKSDGNFTHIQFDALSISTYSTLTIYDYNNSQPTKILSISNSKNYKGPYMVTLPSLALLISWSVESSSANTGWLLNWKTITGCGNSYLTQSNGQIDSNGGNALYENNKNCTWIIEPYGTEIGNAIVLNFSTFDTESGVDIMTIHEGTNSTGPQLISTSGSSLPTILYSLKTNPSFFITFTTNSAGQSSGFLAKYITLPCKNRTVTIGSELYISDGSNDNVGYTIPCDCYWFLYPQQNDYYLKISFQGWNVAKPNRLQISSLNDGTVLGDYVNISSTPKALSNFGGTLLTWNVVNVAYNYWRIKVLPSNCPLETTHIIGTSGSFADRNNSRTRYFDDEKCTWRITSSSPNATSITINITYFRVGDEDEELSIYDGTTSNSPRLVTFDEDDRPSRFPQIITTKKGASAFILWETESAATGGWNITWFSNYGSAGCEFVGCNDTNLNLSTICTNGNNTRTCTCPPGFSTSPTYRENSITLLSGQPFSGCFVPFPTACQLYKCVDNLQIVDTNCTDLYANDDRICTCPDGYSASNSSIINSILIPNGGTFVGCFKNITWNNVQPESLPNSISHGTYVYQGNVSVADSFAILNSSISISGSFVIHDGSTVIFSSSNVVVDGNFTSYNADIQFYDTSPIIVKTCVDIGNSTITVHVTSTDSPFSESSSQNAIPVSDGNNEVLLIQTPCLESLPLVSLVDDSENECVQITGVETKRIDINVVLVFQVSNICEEATSDISFLTIITWSSIGGVVLISVIIVAIVVARKRNPFDSLHKSNSREKL